MEKQDITTKTAELEVKVNSRMDYGVVNGKIIMKPVNLFPLTITAREIPTQLKQLM